MYKLLILHIIVFPRSCPSLDFNLYSYFLSICYHIVGHILYPQIQHLVFNSVTFMTYKIGGRDSHPHSLICCVWYLLSEFRPYLSLDFTLGRSICCIITHTTVVVAGILYYIKSYPQYCPIPLGVSLF